MSTIRYTLQLTSDAEVGSGLGNEIVNDIVARDHEGMPVLRGSHLKGLLRAALADVAASRGWPSTLADWCFGRAGAAGDDGEPGAALFRDARPMQSEAKVRTITRTSLTELGVVHGQTLRTTEAVAAGTTFQCEVTVAPEAPEAVDVALRLSLSSLEAVGGNRTRGSGACCVTIDGESRAPSALLAALDEVLRRGLRPRVPVVPIRRRRPDHEGSAVTWLLLVFRADDPVCCPETPVVENNLLRSGPAIPASAVQGALISRLAIQDADLATSTLVDSRTRVWPLLPCAPNGPGADPPIPVRVALSHRMSKLPSEANEYRFADSAVEPYDWRTVAHGCPLKGGDGVLLRGSDGSIQLWRSGDLPRLITAHAVHHDATGRGRRNLFTVESLAPATFAGFACLPSSAAKVLLASLEADRAVRFGKARTLRGGGALEATVVDPEAAFGDWNERVFIVQSPAAIPDDWTVNRQSAESLLARLVVESGWGEVQDLAREPGQIAVTTLAACGVRFGWNRHGLGEQVGETRRLRARRVVLPGSVFLLKERPANLPQLLQRGLGVEVDGEVDGREQGLGAVLPHPGVATTRYQPPPKLEEIASTDAAGKLALEWWRASGERQPSPSQIAAVRDRIRPENGAGAAEYLDRQRTGRSKRVWERWECVFDAVVAKVRSEPKLAERALRTWQELVMANRNAEER